MPDCGEGGFNWIAGAAFRPQFKLTSDSLGPPDHCVHAVRTWRFGSGFPPAGELLPALRANQ